MSIDAVLRSHKAAWLLGGALLAFVGVCAYGLVGWLGILIVGLVGLLVSTTLALNSGRAVVDSGYIGSSDASMYARQVEEERRSQASPEQKMAAEAARRERSRVLYLVNSVFIAMTALGLWMFIQHDL